MTEATFTFAEPSGDGRRRSHQPEHYLFAAAALRLATARSAMPPDAPAPLPADAISRLRPAANPVTRYLAGRECRPESMSKYRHRLKRAQELLLQSGFAHATPGMAPEDFPWHRITADDAASFRRAVRDHFNSPKSADNIVCICREMVRQCARVGLMSADQRDDVHYELLLKAISRTNVGRVLDTDELEKSMRVATTTQAACTSG